MAELIDKQVAINAMCAACGHDCDKSKFVYNAPQDEQVIMCPEHYALSTLPSAQPYTAEEIPKMQELESAQVEKAYELGRESAQPEQLACEYCHEDSDGYVMPIEKNGHAFICFSMNGWELSLRAKGWHGSAKIKYCPICGRDLLVK